MLNEGKGIALIAAMLNDQQLCTYFIVLLFKYLFRTSYIHWFTYAHSNSSLFYLSHHTPLANTHSHSDKASRAIRGSDSSPRTFWHTKWRREGLNYWLWLVENHSTCLPQCTNITICYVCFLFFYKVINLWRFILITATKVFRRDLWTFSWANINPLITYVCYLKLLISKFFITKKGADEPFPSKISLTRHQNYTN